MIGQAKRLYELNDLQYNKLKSKFTAPLIAFTSGKGGTGKSFIATNYALLLSKQGKKVLVIDFDQNFANIHILLNIIPQKNLYHFFNDENNLKDIIYNYNSNLDFIFGESGKTDYPEFNENLVYKLISELSFLSVQYDVIIFDTSSGGNKETIKLLNYMDIIYLVSSSQPTAVMDGYVILKLLKFNKNNSLIKVIMNKSCNDTGVEAFNNLFSASQHFLNTEIEYAGNIAFNNDVTDSIANQEVFVEKYLQSEVTVQLEQIVNDFVNNKHVVNNSQ